MLASRSWLHPPSFSSFVGAWRTFWPLSKDDAHDPPHGESRDVVLKHRPRSDPKTISPTALALLDAINQSGLTDYYITRKAGLSRTAITLWRSGITHPRAVQIDWVMQVIGAKMTIELVPQGEQCKRR